MTKVKWRGKERYRLHSAVLQSRLHATLQNAPIQLAGTVHELVV
jgi:hypothetical protein